MARKQRRLEQVAAAATDTKPVTRYQDPLQQNINSKLNDVGKKFEGKGRTILYGVAALAVILILFLIVSSYNRRSNGAAQAALGKAIETSQSKVSDTPAAAGSTDKVFKSEKERAEAAISEFQSVADKFGGSVGEKAKYFIAVNKLTSDRPAGITELEGIAKGSSDVAKLAKFALAQKRAEDGKFDESVTIYQELIAMSDAIVAKDTINFELAKVYQKQNKTKEAADIFFTIAKTANDAKDSDGKAIPMTETARDAKEKLTQLDPERAKEIVEAPPESPFG